VTQNQQVVMHSSVEMGMLNLHLHTGFFKHKGIVSVVKRGRIC
jgi:hypothetical protein